MVKVKYCLSERWLFVLVLVITFLSIPFSANAHMGVSSSNPANGSSIKSAPSEATIKFNALVDLDTVEAQLRYIGGVDTPLSEASNREVRTEALVKSSGSSLGSTASFKLPELANGFYALDWAVNESGGHSNTSSILFKVTGSEDDRSSTLSTPTSAFKFVGPGLVVILILLIYTWLGRIDG
jgi:methionine-rich copper-binding protein CopC